MQAPSVLSEVIKQEADTHLTNVESSALATPALSPLRALGGKGINRDVKEQKALRRSLSALIDPCREYQTLVSLLVTLKSSFLSAGIYVPTLLDPEFPDLSDGTVYRGPELKHKQIGLSLQLCPL